VFLEDLSLDLYYSL